MKNQLNIYLDIENFMLQKGYKEFLNTNFSAKVSFISKLGDLLQIDFCEESDQVLICDLDLKNLKNQLSLLHHLVQKIKRLRIVVLTESFDRKRIKFLFSVGVDAVLSKDVSRKELIGVFERMLQNEKYLSSDYKELLINEYCKENKKFDQRFKNSKDLREDIMDFDNDIYGLTRREKEVLNLICNGNSTKHIAERLFISSYTVQTHRRNLLRKLNVRNTAEMVKRSVMDQLIPA